jgi:hypothetical protein
MAEGHAEIGGAIRIGGWFQGPTGSGQGGWTAQRLAARLPLPVTTAIRAPIPLDTDLRVVADADRWVLVDPAGTEVMVATAWDPVFASTDPVPVAAARAARARFGAFVAEHPVPYCFSCGVQHDSMNVHAAPIDDDRVATDWTVPDWAVDADGRVDPGALWAAIDCCAAWWVGFTRAPRIAFTAQYAVEELHPLEPGATYALVGWSGDHDPEWDGRKRHAASAAFDADGRCVGRSVSLWVAARPELQVVSDTS